MRSRQAATRLRSADLASDFGRDLAVRWFGEEALASLPVLKAGPRKGKPKGFVLWLSTIEAGYHVNAGGGVAAGTTVRAWIAPGAYSGEDSAYQGMWLGRVQAVCGSRALLGPEARAAWMAAERRGMDELRAALQAEG
jgi:hypothetical protein